MNALPRMIQRARRLCIGLMLLLAMAAAHADTIFSENFQDGTIDGWTTAGTVYANLYAGNYSIGMAGAGASARRTVSTVGYSSVNISLQMAANSLELSETCIAEVSINGGSTWTTALTLGDGQDNSALYTAASVPVNADNNGNVVIRFRTNVAQSNDNCYGDNIVVTGTSGGGGGWTPPPDVYDPLSGNGAVSRSLLTYSTLTTGSDPGSRISLSGYALPANAAEPTQFFQGRLTLNNTATGGGFAEIVDTYTYTNATDNPRKHLPPFDFEFIQTGSHIFPLQRGSIASTHANWEFVLSPGRVWNENGDNGYSRAAIPFALQQRNANCTHNGVLSFLFKNDGSSATTTRIYGWKLHVSPPRSEVCVIEYLLTTLRERGGCPTRNGFFAVAGRGCRVSVSSVICQHRSAA